MQDATGWSGPDQTQREQGRGRGRRRRAPRVGDGRPGVTACGVSPGVLWGVRGQPGPGDIGLSLSQEPGAWSLGPGSTSIGSHEQTKFRSPCTSSRRETVGHILLRRNDGSGNAAFERGYLRIPDPSCPIMVPILQYWHPYTQYWYPYPDKGT